MWISFHRENLNIKGILLLLHSCDRFITIENLVRANNAYVSACLRSICSVIYLVHFIYRLVSCIISILFNSIPGIGLVDDIAFMSVIMSLRCAVCCSVSSAYVHPGFSWLHYCGWLVMLQGHAGWC